MHGENDLILSNLATPVEQNEQQHVVEKESPRPSQSGSPTRVQHAAHQNRNRTNRWYPALYCIVRPAVAANDAVLMLYRIARSPAIVSQRHRWFGDANKVKKGSELIILIVRRVVYGSKRIPSLIFCRLVID